MAKAVQFHSTNASDNFKRLPFVAGRRPTKRNPYARTFWKVESTGSYSKDCDLGAYYGDRAIAAMIVDGDLNLLGSIVGGMIGWHEQGRTADGIVIGFMMAISNAAVRGQQAAR